ncbi:MAG: hypothetical protein B6I32_07025 [Desulfobacterium sp. 4572_20]|nr:MAG: hypothetical protein B6I32_07025 [Desulfobacterium sp. 4572_20]
MNPVSEEITAFFQKPKYCNIQTTYLNSYRSQEKNHPHRNLLPFNRKGFRVRETKLSLPGMEAFHKSLNPWVRFGVKG